jgi:hypothetical protein
MKKMLILLLAAGVLAATSCKKDSASPKYDVGGDTNLEGNQVGTTYPLYIKIGNTAIDATKDTVKVTKNDNGVITLYTSIAIPTAYQAIPLFSGLVNSSGRIVKTIQIKNTSEGIVDYYNKTKQPFLLVKYDASVGDSWSFATTDGKTATRKVTSISTTDDFYWDGMLIKVITIEQNSTYPGVQKITYKANHKWGLVFISAILDDGTVLETTIQ